MDQSSVPTFSVLSNPKHRMLADLVLTGKTQTQAAIDLGYSPRSASTRAAEILARPDVQAYLAAKREQLSAEHGDVQSRVIQELTDMALENNIHDLITIDSRGRPVVDFSKATRKALKSVTGVSSKTSTRYDKDGKQIGTEEQSSFRYADKYRGLELLGRAVGMFKPDEQRLVVDVADRLLEARRRVTLLASDSE